MDSREFGHTAVHVSPLTLGSWPMSGDRYGKIDDSEAVRTIRQALEVALHSVGHAADARIAVVRSTADLDELWVSEALRAEVAANPALTILSADPALNILSADASRSRPPLNILSTAEQLAFDADGRLAVVSAPRPLVHSSVK